MPYYRNPTYTIVNDKMVIPHDCIITVEGKQYFSYLKLDTQTSLKSGIQTIMLDNTIDISKLPKSSLEDLVFILGVNKSEIKKMKKKDLVQYLTPRIEFERE